MQTNFSLAQLADPKTAEAEAILRKCVHCGFCTATCPTYVTLGNELDSPRGRIYLIKDMLENDRQADETVATHVDRCLSCLACTTTCPSGVDYMHLIDHARVHVEKTYRRPLMTRLQRAVLAWLMPSPRLFRSAMTAAKLAKPFAGVMKRVPALRPFGAMLDLAPASLPAPSPYAVPGRFAAEGEKRKRVALLTGCVQSVMDPGINKAAIELMTRFGVEVVLPKGEGCCGSLRHHMGHEEPALASARRNIDAWIAEMDGDGLDAIVITGSGCGTTIKDYGHMLKSDPVYAAKASRVAALARDVTEMLDLLDLPELEQQGTRVAYHAACSLQHGQKITLQPKSLLRKAGFTVVDPAEGHLCCGSAGTYNMLQPEISSALKERKVRNLKAVKPDVIAAGNLGCITQIADAAGAPIVHTVQLLNWAYGGEKPAALG
ncbi:glycolate oxidase iron-sulfur subunit [Rhizobium sp. SG_E_25_P2]|uniref:glycolate oxidase subunit GlcF n=1 Tax=Rhizobium sp. SG_E_25_P2 TaxID=2879942 RepID=UPI0024753732|nr:glycolate oxidase subunit GlcF [Rhizobium sp. SG_E_25_P2]MDH6264721.1 glycolate oxidase iron-sulfur subunit [Rhizobium sp. SG_E_25_P2]